MLVSSSGRSVFPLSFVLGIGNLPACFPACARPPRQLVRPAVQGTIEGMRGKRRELSCEWGEAGRGMRSERVGKGKGEQREGRIWGIER